MKKDYTLKLVLAMLVVVLVSLVSFVGVYKGRNLLKEYSLGKDFSKRKIATFSVVEEEASEQVESGETEDQVEESEEENESSEGEEESSEQSGEENTNQAQPLSEEEKTKNYNTAKNNIAKRLTAMKSEEYDIRLDESTGKLVIEVPEDMDSTFISEVVSKGKVEIKNTSSNEVIADGEVFKDASAVLRDETFSTGGMQQVTKKIVVLNMKLTKDGKKKITEANPKYTDSDGNETDAVFGIFLDGEKLYDEDASSFIDTAEKNGGFELYMGQNDQGEELEKDYQTALAITAIIKCGEIPVDYQIDTMELISSSINIKSIIVASIVIGVLMLVFAMYKFKLKGVLPVISLVGLVAAILLVLRYTNVKITLFTILGIAIVTLANYIVVLRTLNNKKLFKENFMKAMDILVPCIIVAIVFCCSPYTQLASFGMTIFWGLIVMCLYNLAIVRVFIEK